ncbi:MAG TPA: hypothetical protein VNY27_04320 [Solirubrobacteraceae bacterium]|nr:hypothetical protein [Solirubrobacteraceae bacterium]
MPLDHPSTHDPDGRLVVFDMGTRLHLTLGRPKLMGEVDLILGTVAHPTTTWTTRSPDASSSTAATSTLGAGCELS